MRIIADGGATKTTWAIIEGKNVIMRFTTGGFNPNCSDISVFADMLRYDLPNLISNAVRSVCYYGAGCGSEENHRIVSEALRQRFPKATIQVNHDLMAAARALFGKSRGIACILGTGSHSCLYDGSAVVDTAVSLGYILGDEGSGCYIGRVLLRDYFYETMPDILRVKFEAVYHPDRLEVLENCYHRSQPSRFLASFAQFAGENKEHPYIQDLCRYAFEDFFTYFVLRYPSAKNEKIGFVGSVAFHFQDVLKQVAENKSMIINRLLTDPMEGLVEYHLAEEEQSDGM